MTDIGYEAFKGCTNLTSVTIPNSVTFINDGAFWNCTSLTSITIYAPPCNLGTNAFLDCNDDLQIYVFSDLVDTYKGAENWRDYAGIITAIPNQSGNCGTTNHESEVTWELARTSTSGVLTISGTGDMADYASADDQPWKDYRSSITSLVIGGGVTGIGNNAFNNCTNLTSVALNGPTTIGSGAFPSNTTVTIASGLYLHNGSEVLCGDVTDMSKLNSKTLQKAVKITLPTGIIASGTNVFNQSDGTYALPNATVTIAADTNYKISNVDATGADLTNNGDDTYTFTVGTTDVTVTATLLTNVVTPSNFSSFFDEYGNLLNSVPFDELIFQGDFSKLNLVSNITLDRSITITGDNAVLNNTGFIIAGDDVTLDNLTLVANNNLGNLIDIAGENATISNNTITYNGGNKGAVAINVAGDIDNPITGVKILNNTIFFESHVPDDEEFAIALKLTGCKGALVDGNRITTALPCVYCNNYDEDYYIMGADKLNAVRLKDCTGLSFTNNTIHSTTNDYTTDFPTIQSMQIIGCHDSVIDHNNISLIDEQTPAGKYNYIYGINFGNNKKVTFSNNNFKMSTTGGIDGCGTAYAFQGVESEENIIGNSITSISNGPNIGIYVASMYSVNSDLIIKDNFINVTGFASSQGSWALVSGIEIQNGDAKIHNNTVYTYNVNNYNENAYMYGISYAQWMYGDRSFDIQNNTVYTEGKYAISVINATSLIVVNNTLCAHELYGDDAVDIKSGNKNKVENNLLGYVMPTTGESTYNIPANVSSFKVYDDGGQGYRYSPGCTGTLTLTAPAGYSLQLSGSIKTEKDVDYLTVYDGSDNQADVLIDQVSSSVNGTETAIPTVTSTGNVMTIYFYSDNSGSDKTEFDGLDLIVTVTAPSTFDLTANLANGSYWTSFYFGGVSYKIDESEDATAYTATRSGDKLTLTSIGKNIPKNTAVIIKGTDDSISLTRDDNITDYTGDNELQGVNYETPQADGYTYYVLSKVNGNFGFFKLASSNMLGAHKAYLKVDAQNSTREFFGFDDSDSEDGIENVNVNDNVNDNAIYNMAGQKLSRPQKGINIINGRKVLF